MFYLLLSTTQNLLPFLPVCHLLLVSHSSHILTPLPELSFELFSSAPSLCHNTLLKWFRNETVFFLPLMFRHDWSTPRITTCTFKNVKLFVILWGLLVEMPTLDIPLKILCFVILCYSTTLPSGIHWTQHPSVLFQEVPQIWQVPGAIAIWRTIYNLLHFC